MIPAKTPAVTLRAITAQTVRTIINLQVSPQQRHLVAPNAVSLAEALFHPEAWYRAVYADEDPVGFVMLYDEHLRPTPPAQPSVVLWRFMIDHRYQGRGIGRLALQSVLERVRGYPALERLELSYVPGAQEPSGFYRRLGFLQTDRWDDGERVMELPLRPLKADHCPICGAPNGCAASACGTFDVKCWCAQARIGAEVLARVPEGLKGRACVCRRCAQELGPGNPA